MSKRYKDEMNKIHIDEEMKKRILYNVLNSSNIEIKDTKLKRERYTINRKHMQFSVACLVLILCTSVLKTYPDVLKVSNNGINIETENLENSTHDDDTMDENIRLNENLSLDNKTNDKHDEDNGNKESVKSNKSVESKKEDVALKDDNQEINKSNTKIAINKDNIDKRNRIDDKVPSNQSVPSGIIEENNKGNGDTDNTKTKLTDEEYTLESNIEDDNAEMLQEDVQNENGISKASFYRERAVNSIVQYKKIEDAESKCGININVSEDIGYNFKIKNINVINNEILEVIYENDSNNLVFRASKTVQDINYDYNSYEYSSVLNKDDVDITFKGDDKNSIKLVLWNKDDTLYSLFINNSMKDEEVNNILDKIV